MYDFYLFVCIVLGELDVAVEALDFRVMLVYTMICDIDDQSLDSFFFFSKLWILYGKKVTYGPFPLNCNYFMARMLVELVPRSNKIFLLLELPFGEVFVCIWVRMCRQNFVIISSAFYIEDYMHGCNTFYSRSRFLHILTIAKWKNPDTTLSLTNQFSISGVRTIS